MAIVSLKHIYANTLSENIFYFYDGQAVVRYGVIELPAENITWLQRAFMQGYRVDPKDGQLLSWEQIVSLAESAKSAGEELEGTDLGGQPAGEDGLRESELPRDAGVPTSGVASSVSPRVAKRTTRN